MQLPFTFNGQNENEVNLSLQSVTLCSIKKVTPTPDDRTSPIYLPSTTHLASYLTPPVTRRYRPMYPSLSGHSLNHGSTSNTNTTTSPAEVICPHKNQSKANTRARFKMAVPSSLQV
ncbi:hypothetical protein Pcinc_030782 [Petrolisthes cinctipes]|uniref:Uncharacterized protein n=1 Tax=Petrolisthes cinctipes TaxID=88211 RepID=A0AAE1K5J2_PETCI|nr:hypothetical protein Pcinc_030782 [Petrolisthes cinctipes]